MKCNLKAPGTKRLKVKHDDLLSSLGFNFNSRRYNKRGEVKISDFGVSGQLANSAGAYTRPLSGSS
jgi:hypothetical protein